MSFVLIFRSYSLIIFFDALLLWLDTFLGWLDVSSGLASERFGRFFGVFLVACWLPVLLFFYTLLAAQLGNYLGETFFSSLLLSIAMVLHLGKLGVYLTVITVL